MNLEDIILKLKRMLNHRLLDNNIRSVSIADFRLWHCNEIHSNEMLKKIDREYISAKSVKIDAVLLNEKSNHKSKVMSLRE